MEKKKHWGKLENNFFCKVDARYVSNCNIHKRDNESLHSPLSFDNFNATLENTCVYSS